LKQQIQELFAAAVEKLKHDGVLAPDRQVVVRFERARQKQYGDFATNVALSLAKTCGRTPRELAQLIIDALPAAPEIDKVEIAGPGFINVFLAADSQFEVVSAIRDTGDGYGRSTMGAGHKVHIEFVSANPTGPLHVGHGRGAAFGDSLARLLAASGFEVIREYYVNDAGRQMDILAVSVWLRYLELCGEQFAFPDNAYQGDYIFDIAATVHREHGDSYRHSGDKVFADIHGQDLESQLDSLIQRARTLLGQDGYRYVLGVGLDALTADIRGDLEQFNVNYDQWFSERSLMDDHHVDNAIQVLARSGNVFEQDGALWFRSTKYGDEKDRVVVRENGAPTYFASDIAYHLNKLERGFDRLIDVWGADHHGYMPRIKAALQAMGYDADRLLVLLVQFATLYRGGEKVSMSTRAGEFVTLRELRQEVGTDAARFFYVQRKAEQHMDFDLDLARSQSNENPVYYVQYAHARICSVFRQATEKHIDTSDLETADLSLLGEAHEIALVNTLSRFPEVVEHAAVNYEPHQVAYYLRNLANDFHTYYNAHNFLGVEPDLRRARVALIDATRQVLANGLELIGVHAPDKM
jgi:arginyl-tRNA synthetase